MLYTAAGRSTFDFLFSFLHSDMVKVCVQPEASGNPVSRCVFVCVCVCWRPGMNLTDSMKLITPFILGFLEQPYLLPRFTVKLQQHFWYKYQIARRAPFSFWPLLKFGREIGKNRQYPLVFCSTDFLKDFLTIAFVFCRHTDLSISATHILNTDFLIVDLCII